MQNTDIAINKPPARFGSNSPANEIEIELEGEVQEPSAPDVPDSSFRIHKALFTFVARYEGEVYGLKKVRMIHLKPEMEREDTDLFQALRKLPLDSPGGSITFSLT